MLNLLRYCVVCHFNGMRIVGDGRVVIGDHFHSGSEILIITQNHNYFRPDARFAQLSSAGVYVN